MIRRFGPTPQKNRCYLRRPGVYAVLRLGDQVLLTHQARPVAEFQLPGGGIDPGESPIPALHREVYEETGWTITGLRRAGAFRRFVYMPDYDIWADKLCTIYTARPVRQIGPPTEPAHEAVWMPAQEAARHLGNSGDRHFAALLAAR
ncbi:8-oxo-dGTP diphosphatase [Salinihabitans flavidus]|uniref:8-oxo-dGTP diphosphatase n=1 Tax=Salinihabitans flavidus TaxID=569882 RepID=A0A1H8LXW4_9RHOB|nr:NUDIX hydrolase [Salinihabitans flavidus]SEO09728.1 8-oxo-dGTP diphosphatase [Salinihabitans flavidus]